MKIGSEVVNSYMKYNFKFSGTRILGNTLYPAQWDLDIDLVAIDRSKEQSKIQLQDSGNTSFQRIYYWLESALAGIVMTDVNNVFGMNVALNTDNTILYSPDDPTDDILIQLIHCKLKNIGGDFLHIGNLSLTSSDSIAGYVYTPNNPYTVPMKVKEYISEGVSLYKDAWWNRADGFTNEFIKPKGTKGKVADVFADVEDPLAVYTSMLDNFAFEMENEDAPVVKVDKWTPKTI